MDKLCNYLKTLGYVVTTFNKPPYVCEISHTALDRPIVFNNWNELDLYVSGLKDYHTVTTCDHDYRIRYRLDKSVRVEIMVAKTISEARELFERVHPTLTILSIDELR